MKQARLGLEARMPSKLLIALIFGSEREIEQAFSRIDRILAARHPWIVFITSGLRKNALAEAVAAADHFSWPAGRDKAQLITQRFGHAFSDLDWIRLFSSCAKKRNFPMADTALKALIARGATDALRACSISMESMDNLNPAFFERHSARIMALADQTDLSHSIPHGAPRRERTARL